MKLYKCFVLLFSGKSYSMRVTGVGVSGGNHAYSSIPAVVRVINDFLMFGFSPFVRGYFIGAYLILHGFYKIEPHNLQAVWSSMRYYL